jgi:hypothetical protein
MYNVDVEYSNKRELIDSIRGPHYWFTFNHGVHTSFPACLQYAIRKDLKYDFKTV